MKIQDVTGKEWVFQFRFWPNNNSRMYVLEGVTPCIQSMRLQAGDTGMYTSGVSYELLQLDVMGRAEKGHTDVISDVSAVTFSRLEADGKLVMGYRRAPSSLSSQVCRC